MNLNIDLVQEIESSLKILIISQIQTSDVLINIAEKKELYPGIMNILKSPDLARSANLLISFEESLTDGDVSEVCRREFRRLVYEILGRLEYDKGYARYDYHRSVVIAKLWMLDTDDKVELIFNPDGMRTEITGIDASAINAIATGETSSLFINFFRRVFRIFTQQR